MTKISFVYFDVGGVAIKDFSDTNKWLLMMDAMGVPSDKRDEFNRIYKDYDDRVCLGLEVDKVMMVLAEKLQLQLKQDFSMLSYFVDHFEPNLGLWPIVESVKAKVKLGLLTDMFPRMLDLIDAKKLLPPVTWDSIVDSSIEKVRKPMPEIYDLAATRTHVDPQEILFIDNRTWNIDGAKKAGWQTFLYDSSDYDLANKDLSTFISQNL
jgi:FMN phosphatase YigB (HAD superfamily)